MVTVGRVGQKPKGNRPENQPSRLPPQTNANNRGRDICDGRRECSSKVICRIQGSDSRLWISPLTLREVYRMTQVWSGRKCGFPHRDPTATTDTVGRSRTCSASEKPLE